MKLWIRYWIGRLLCAMDRHDWKGIPQPWMCRCQRCELRAFEYDGYYFTEKNTPQLHR